MEQIELITDIETDNEIEKRGGETGKISNPLPREKIRPIETGRAKPAKAYIPREKIIHIFIAAAILIGILVFTLVLPKDDLQDYLAPSEKTHTSEKSAPAEPPSPINFGRQTSDSSLSANEAKNLIETFNKLRTKSDKTGETL
jgi:hypothetical protein